MKIRTTTRKSLPRHNLSKTLAGRLRAKHKVMRKGLAGFKPGSGATTHSWRGVGGRFRPA